MTDEQIRLAAEKEAERQAMSYPDDWRRISTRNDAPKIATQITEALRILDQAGYVVLPRRLTHDLITAACEGHYGKKLVQQSHGVRGVDMTADGINYNFEQAFRRMYRAMLAALTQEKGRT